MIYKRYVLIGSNGEGRNANELLGQTIARHGVQD